MMLAFRLLRRWSEVARDKDSPCYFDPAEDWFWIFMVQPEDRIHVYNYFPSEFSSYGTYPALGG